MHERVHLRIRGRVQGVGYRAWTEGQARQHGVTGWVRNLPDGSVQALFEGPRQTLQAMIKRCHQGPRLAVVHRIDERWEAAGGAVGFDIRDTPLTLDQVSDAENP